MRRATGPLVCELLAHTWWSDGELTVPELVDLHGRSGFDVLCVTDRTVRWDDPWREREGPFFSTVNGGSGPGTGTTSSAKRSGRGGRTACSCSRALELTFNDDDPDRAAHAVAVALHEFVSVDDGIAEAMRTAAEAGAAIIAAHPTGLSAGAEPAPGRTRVTRRFARDAALRGLAHRFELFNRTQLFGWVADAALPAVATGDFHREQHLTGWKTLLPCRHDEQAVVEYLRSSRPVYLARFDAELSRAAA